MSAFERPASRVRGQVQTAAYWLLVVFVLGYTWFPSTRAQDSSLHSGFFTGCILPVGLVALVLSWRRLVSARGNAVLWAALAFIGYLTASSFWTRGVPELSLGDTLLAGLSTAVFFLLCFLLLGGRRRTQFLATVAIGSAVAASVSIVAWLWAGQLGSFLEGLDRARLRRLFHFEHPNLLAHYLGFAAIVAVAHAYRRRDNRWWFVACSLILGVGLTGSRAAGGTLLLVLIALAVWLQPRLVGVLVVVTVGLTSIVAGTPYGVGLLQRGDAGRDTIYLHLLAETHDAEWVGLGLRTRDDVEFPRGSGDFPHGFTMPHAHSALVSTYFHGGLVGVGGLALLAVLAAWSALRRARQEGDPTLLALLAFAVGCLVLDGNRLVSHPHLSSWLLWWLPVALIAADHGREVCRSDDPVPAGDPRPKQQEKPGNPAVGTLRLPVGVFLLLAVLFLAQRFWHLDSVLDDPHMWRQADTAHIVRSFAEEGIDLLAPTMCWMGSHRTLILEFPLPEAVAALAHRGFGPDLLVSRLVFLGFFLASSVGLFLLVRALAVERIARIAVLLSLAAPLALYYSRAIHIDYSVLALGHFAAWCAIVAMRRDGWGWWVSAALLGGVALVIKPPTILPVACLVGFVALREQQFARLVRRWPVVVGPVLAFALWRWHVGRVNGQLPDWSFIPDYHRFDDRAGWYFGPLVQRFDLTNWLKIGRRVLWEILGWAALIPAVVGLITAVRERIAWPLVWLAAGIASTALFFNLNLVHDYYQLPLIAPLAVVVAYGVDGLAGWMVSARGGRHWLMVALLLLVVFAEGVSYAHGNYYGRLPIVTEAGSIIARQSDPEDLVIVSYGGLDSRSPHLLYHAHRFGWSIPHRDLQPSVLAPLFELGARHLAVVGRLPDDPQLGSLLQNFEWRRFPLPSGGFVLILTKPSDGGAGS